MIHNNSFNSLWPGDAIWCRRSWSTLVQVMAWYYQATSHYLNQCQRIHQCSPMVFHLQEQFHRKGPRYQLLKWVGNNGRIFQGPISGRLWLFWQKVIWYKFTFLCFTIEHPKNSVWLHHYVYNMISIQYILHFWNSTSLVSYLQPLFWRATVNNNEYYIPSAVSM